MPCFRRAKFEALAIVSVFSLAFGVFAIGVLTVVRWLVWLILSALKLVW